ncbi:MAG: hypothetical protein ABIQ18_10615, partial [Umezawaea sp.]
MPDGVNRPQQTDKSATTRPGRSARGHGLAAKEQGVPAHVLLQVAAPTPLPELGTVSGVGGNEVVKYGRQVLDALASTVVRPLSQQARRGGGLGVDLSVGLRAGGRVGAAHGIHQLTGQAKA